jgi:hypothetical protein
MVFKTGYERCLINRWFLERSSYRVLLCLRIADIEKQARSAGGRRG